jgi:predicted dehydrogenase
MEAMWLRIDPLVRHASQLARAGTIGDLVSVRADLCRRFDYDPNGRLFDLHAGGGALLDLGVYSASFAWEFLGQPDTIAAAGSRSPTGSDLTAATQWGYADGRVAQMFSSASSDSPYAGLVTGTSGWLRIESRIHRPTALTVHIDGQPERVVPASPIAGNGHGYEIAEVERCLRAGNTESPLVPLDGTVGILATLEEARLQLGVRYACD